MAEEIFYGCRECSHEIRVYVFSGNSRPLHALSKEVREHMRTETPRGLSVVACRECWEYFLRMRIWHQRRIVPAV